MNLHERIARSVDLSGLSQNDIARQLETTQDNVSNWVRGVVKNPKIEVLTKLAEICNVDLKWLITGKGEMIKSEPIKYGSNDLTLIPILGRIPAGFPVYSEEIRDGHVPYMRDKVPKNAFALKVDGDSMEPELEDGNIVICIPKSYDELQGKGEIVALRMHTETTIKRFIKCKNQVVLSSINTKYQPIVIKPEEISFLAKVISKIKNYK